jgi:alkylation response protein AidB-like acyl-CoA dehydrogenase
MTFELSQTHAAARDRARAYAQAVAHQAAEFDRAGAVPSSVARDIGTLGNDDLLALVVVVEEIAAASAAVAALLAGSADAQSLRLSGLRGAKEVEPSPRAQLVLAAVALGIGKAAIDEALAELRRTNKLPGADVEKPHWVVADVATELEAARLLTYKAAGTTTDADIALARLMTATAAMRAVDAAVRVLGAAALVEGTIVERLARDVRAVSVLLGTEEDQRALAAEGLLPH